MSQYVFNAPPPEWVWQVPAAWVWTRMADIADVVGGGTPPTSEPANFDGGDIPWITPADLSGYREKHISRGVRNITERGLKHSGARMMPAGTVLFSSRAPVGYVAIAANPVTTNQGFKSFVLAIGVDPSYVYFYLKSARALIETLAGGTTFKEISGAKATQIPVPLAPFSEQHRIVAEIEKHFTRLDAAVTSLQRVQADLKRYRASVLKAACEGRLVPTEADLARREGRGYEPAAVLLERILKERRARREPQERRRGRYKEPQPPDTADLPSLPEGWVWATLEQLAANEPFAITDGPFGSNLKTSHYTPSGARVIRLQNVGDGRFVDERAYVSMEHFNSLRKHHVHPRDLIIAALGQELPRACVVPGFIGPAMVKADCIRFRLDPRIAVPEFLNYVLNAESTRKRTAKIVHGVGRPRLNLQEIKAIAVPVPPLTEQQRIVAEAERRLSAVEATEMAIEANLRRAERLRQAILRRAFGGKLVPQDPTDEPASVLLERIRAEREQAEGKTVEARRKTGRRRKAQEVSA